MADNIIAALITFGAALLAWLGGRATAMANAKNTDVKTITELSEEVRKLVADRVKDRSKIDELETRLDDVERKNFYLWRYASALVDGWGKTEAPPAPPKELESDPELIKMFKGKKK